MFYTAPQRVFWIRVVVLSMVLVPLWASVLFRFAVSNHCWRRVCKCVLFSLLQYFTFIYTFWNEINQYAFSLHAVIKNALFNAKAAFYLLSVCSFCLKTFYSSHCASSIVWVSHISTVFSSLMHLHFKTIKWRMLEK